MLLAERNFCTSNKTHLEAKDEHVLTLKKQKSLAEADMD